jgi:hypothetical protein
MIIFLRILSLLFLCVIAYICYTTKDFRLIAFATVGFVAGILFVMSYVLDISRKLQAYKRELEKNSISSDEKNSKVTVLEAKIEVLEKALDDLLKNK